MNLNELEKAARAAGGDKWTYDGMMFVSDVLGNTVCDVRGRGRGMDEKVAQFITAASPEAILELIQRARVLERALETRESASTVRHDAKIAELEAIIAAKQAEIVRQTRRADNAVAVLRQFQQGTEQGKMGIK